jgi:hypothetical protein
MGVVEERPSRAAFTRFVTMGFSPCGRAPLHGLISFSAVCVEERPFRAAFTRFVMMGL